VELLRDVLCDRDILLLKEIAIDYFINQDFRLKRDLALLLLPEPFEYVFYTGFPLMTLLCESFVNNILQFPDCGFLNLAILCGGGNRVIENGSSDFRAKEMFPSWILGSFNSRLGSFSLLMFSSLSVRTGFAFSGSHIRDFDFGNAPDGVQGAADHPTGL
jgi:hypothetical protein